LAHCENLEFYTIEFVDSHFYLCGHGYHHDCVDVDSFVVGTAGVDDDAIVLYLGYYDWSSSRQLYVGLVDSPSFV